MATASPENLERRIARLEHVTARHEAHARENAGVLSAVANAHESIGKRFDALDLRLDAQAKVDALFRARTTLALERLERAAGTTRTGSLSDEAIAEMIHVEAEAKRESVRARGSKRVIWHGFLADLRRAMLVVLLAGGAYLAARIRACSPLIDSVVQPEK